MIHQWVYEITMIHRRFYELTMIHQWVYDPSNWKVFKGDKIWKTSKIFNLKSYFSIWSSKKSTPPTWGFEILLKFTFNLHLNLIKKSVWGKSNWKVFKGDKIWKTSKIFNLKSYFSIWSSKKSTPPTWGFEILLKFTFNLHLHLIKKSVWGKSNWKVFKGDKIWKTSKIFNLKSYFSIWSSKKSTPPTWGFEILLKFTFNLHLHLIKKSV